MVTHDLWPAPATVLLLRAALTAGDGARAAFEAWLASGAAEPALEARELPSPDRRLLPLVAKNLTDQGFGHPFLEVCAAEARRVAERNQHLLEITRDVAAALAAASIPVLALKGVPLLLEYYRDRSLRYMSDVDLMIRPDDAERALAVLRELGFHDEPVVAGLRPYVCAYELRGPGGRALDLHQYLNDYGSSREAERGLWQRAHPLPGLGAPALAPSPTDMLLHVCVASLKVGHERNSRWIVDAVRILRAPIDWELLVMEAERRRMVLAVRECLEYLVGLLPGSVPAPVLEQLARLPVGRAEQHTYHVLTHYPHSLAQLAGEYWARYEFGTRAAGRRTGPASFVRFCSLLLQQRWRLRSPWLLPSTAIGKLARRVRGT